MKKYLKLLAIALLLVNASCETWLDVSPENQIIEEDMFASSFGFRTALNGLYVRMGETPLYGADLSFRLVDILSNQYDLSELNIENKFYRDIAERNFENAQARNQLDAVWGKAYNIIANANNIINNIEGKEDEFFEGGELEKNMIQGEAIACKALMHFDMLRLFAPTISDNDNGKYIPYVASYPNTRPISTTVSECMKYVLEDLEKARELTMSYDTTDFGYGACFDGNARFLDEHSWSSPLYREKDKVDLFFKNRGFRLNYFAVTALMARAYQYAGEHEKALECAEEVINAEYKGRWSSYKLFKFNVSGIDHNLSGSFSEKLIEWSNKSNLRLLDNLIFAAYNSKLANTNVKNSFFVNASSGEFSSALYFCPKLESQKLFYTTDNIDESTKDIRNKYLIFHASYGAKKISGKWFMSDNESTLDKNFNILPVIRLTEMYYIAAESYARAGNFVKAQELLTKVRAERSCSHEISVKNWDEFEEELVNDARREWISEGQLFYLYKRLKAPVDFTNGKDPRPFNRKETVLPIPTNQSL